MAIRIVRLGSDRLAGEGLRLGTVRRPPRGVAKTDYAAKNYFDVWLPTLAPTPASVKMALAAKSQAEWQRFVKQYRREMSGTNETAVLNALAALSHRTNFSVGCYCADEAHCHRAILRQLLNERGAKIE
jgi:uncharacterized protein YeaO (DUF488 family)